MHGRVFTACLAGLFVLAFLPFGVRETFCQNTGAFTSADEFKLDSSQGSIRFAYNGTFSSATQSNGRWQFNDLALNNSSRTGNLQIAAENSNVTIFSYRAGNLFLRSARVTYNAEGNGTQTLNFCLNNTQPTHWSEWSVIVPDNVFLAQGKNWRLLPDDSVVVSGIVGNVTVVHYSFQMPNTADQPFHVQHSVGLATAAALAATVAVALTIKIWVKR